LVGGFFAGCVVLEVVDGVEDGCSCSNIAVGVGNWAWGGVGVMGWSVSGNVGWQVIGAGIYN